MQFSKTQVFKQYEGTASAKGGVLNDIPPYPKDSFTAMRPPRLYAAMPRSSMGMAPILEKEDEGYELNQFNYLLCDTVQQLVDFMLQMTQSIDEMKRELIQLHSRIEMSDKGLDVKEILGRFEDKESSFS